MSFAITDAATDQVESFTVDVTRVRLTSVKGTEIDVLDAPIEVDLAQLSDLSRVLDLRALPAGLYTQASLTLDLPNASVFLVGASAPASIVDLNGAAITQPLTLPLSLGSDPFHAVAGQHHLLEFDFDLDQSITANLGTNTVTLVPAVSLHADSLSHKKLTLEGALVSVDPSNARTTLEARDKNGVALGQTSLRTAPTTVFQVDGTPLLGFAGLHALAALGAGAWVQAYGVDAPHSAELLAQYVEAGIGADGTATDLVDGHVVDRVGGAGSDAVLTVLGHLSSPNVRGDAPDALFQVRATFGSTRVVRAFADHALDLDAIGVGQRIRAFGIWSGTELDASSARGVIRELPTEVYGHTLAAPIDAHLRIALARVDLFDESLFDWNASGGSPIDPAHFTLDIGSLGVGWADAPAAPVRARGFFGAVSGDSGEFVADELEDLSSSPVLLVVHDKSGGFVVTTTATSTVIDFALDGTPAIGEAALIDHGFVGSQALANPGEFTVIPASGVDLYTLRDELTGSLQVYGDFAAFSGALADDLARGALLGDFTAVGNFDVSTQLFRAELATAVVH